MRFPTSRARRPSPERSRSPETRPIQKPREVKLFADEEWDPYAVRPEDALDAARRGRGGRATIADAAAQLQAIVG